MIRLLFLSLSLVMVALISPEIEAKKKRYAMRKRTTASERFARQEKMQEELHKFKDAIGGTSRKATPKKKISRAALDKVLMQIK